MNNVQVNCRKFLLSWQSFAVCFFVVFAAIKVLASLILTGAELHNLAAFLRTLFLPMVSFVFHSILCTSLVSELCQWVERQYCSFPEILSSWGWKRLVDLAVLKPCWLSGRRLCVSRNFVIWLNTTFSSAFEAATRLLVAFSCLCQWDPPSLV